jgi:uncharacterized protein
MNYRLLLSLVLLSPACAFGADDSKPVLTSTTGGGTTWSDVNELKKDADAGKPAALAAYGDMLLIGDQVQKDVAQGLALLERAAKENQPSAAFRLGKVYDDGELAPRDPKKALTYYKQAALAGVVEAQYNIGALLVGGRGVKRDLKEGLAWLILAGKNGAEGSGEHQVRERLLATNRAQVVAEAEARAAELQKQAQTLPNFGRSGPALSTSNAAGNPVAGADPANSSSAAKQNAASTVKAR